MHSTKCLNSTRAEARRSVSLVASRARRRWAWMQFTDRRGHGTYSFVVRSCRGAQLDPNFERGSTRLARRNEGGRLPARHRSVTDEQRNPRRLSR